ncbi:MAG: dihydroorotate dehydrogenase electron transfer subunit [Candidatus Latescibacterota bacterium]|nr:dihydroorotate dehydrogenase electron transfer subunit [Candidatus Latescibacterota bacterium]
MTDTQITRHQSVRLEFSTEVADGLFLSRFHAPDLARLARPGQFVQLKLTPENVTVPYLRIPLSVADVDADAGTADVIFEDLGPKSHALRAVHAGESIGCIGPLGNGFPSDAGGRPILVGGGIGVPPLLFHGRQLRGAGAETVFLVGAKTAVKHLPVEMLLQSSVEARLATDDGSVGHHGLVTDLLADIAGPDNVVYTCGPHGMMAAVARLSAERGTTCYASLEEYMACGFGVCVGCVVPRAGEVETEYHRYTRVCVDGPVYHTREIAW